MSVSATTQSLDAELFAQKQLLLYQYDDLKNNEQQALSDLDLLLSQQPHNALALTARANLLTKLGRVGEAVRFYSDALAVQGEMHEGPQEIPEELLAKRAHAEQILVVADTNRDGIVDCGDLAIIRASFGKKTGQSGFDPRADVNGDGIVNVLDLSTVAQQLPAGTACK